MFHTTPPVLPDGLEGDRIELHPIGTARSDRPPVALALQLLDEIDYGLILIGHNGEVEFVNRAALAHCGPANAPLRLAERRLCARDEDENAALALALAQARRGKRSLVALGRRHEHAVRCAAVPLAGCIASAFGQEASDAAVALIFGRHQLCESLSVDFFARAHALTGAEARVLRLLCAGARVASIARELDVEVSTIRTHLAHIRLKTDTAGIFELIQQTALLPPIVTALRMEAQGEPRER
jgi:DNA-binding CsgD family transcriptional regulator